MIRIAGFILSVSITILLIVGLNTTIYLSAPLGKLLSPQEGVWQNAEPVGVTFNIQKHFANLKGPVEVYLDDRMVPHVFAENELDAYFVQGFIHAKFRLWQMEFQTLAAAGRISEVIGEKALDYDRKQRRMGMVYGAEKLLEQFEADPDTKSSCDAYTEGVNAYIKSLSESQLPIEYKLIGNRPEKWTNLKTALFIMAMTNDLAGYDTDFENTNLLHLLGEQKFNLLFPDVNDSLSPVIPKGIAFTQSVPLPMQPADADSIYFHRTDSVWFQDELKPNPDNGSNNWAVSGSKTKSGRPILCNDPHLSLRFPSIWFEMQINTPTYNSYGVSFPGIPGIVIGFNDHVAFGFTNSGRDVKDYYEIKFKDQTKKEYWFNNQWQPSKLRIEHIQIKGRKEILDTVAYTVFGPVMYDATYQDKLKQNKSYALRWTAHDGSNPLKMWYLLNRAKNYDDYLNAIKYFHVPGQNMLFASKSGDIALWQQAKFPLRWKGQGLFVMPGFDSSYMWKGFIPQEDNPHAFNPSQGFLSSANQRPVDSTYPYFIPGRYDVYRGIMVNKLLSNMQDITPEDMKKMQTNNHNVFAETIRPLILQSVQQERLTSDARKYLSIFTNWNLENNPDQKGPTIFINWFDSLQAEIFHDELGKTTLPITKPDRHTTVELLLKDSVLSFIDDVNTPVTEGLPDIVTNAFLKCIPLFTDLDKEGKLQWGKYKNTTIYHLFQANMMPFAREGLAVGGGSTIINATGKDHGPSWRMVVHLTDQTEAYVVYPGGQSGNPGSAYYDNFVDTWAKGDYYKAWIMKKNEKNNNKIKGKIMFSRI